MALKTLPRTRTGGFCYLAFLKYIIIIIGVSHFIMLIPMANWVELKTCCSWITQRHRKKAYLTPLGHPDFPLVLSLHHLSRVLPPHGPRRGLLVSGTRASCVTRKIKVLGAPRSPPCLTVPTLPQGPRTTRGPKGQ